MSHSKLLQWGLLVLILADIVLALSGHWSTLLIGVALWGIHMGMTRACWRRWSPIRRHRSYAARRSVCLI